MFVIDRMCSFAVKTRTSFRTCFIIMSDIFENVNYYFVICFICYGDEALGLKIICHGPVMASSGGLNNFLKFPCEGESQLQTE